MSMTTETSNAREWVSLLDRAVPFLHDEAAKYDDDGSNEPLELAREIETLLASLPSDESALSPASLAFDGGREAAPCPHTRDTNCDCTAPPPAAARGDVRGLVDALVDAAYQDGMQELDVISDETLSARSALEQALAAEGVQAGEVEERVPALTTLRFLPDGIVQMDNADFEKLRTTAALAQQPEARQITPEWVIGYFPANVAQQYRNAVSDAFAEFAALHPKPEARGVVDDAMVERGTVAAISASTQYAGTGAGDAWRHLVRDVLTAALTGERNG